MLVEIDPDVAVAGAVVLVAGVADQVGLAADGLAHQYPQLLAAAHAANVLHVALDCGAGIEDVDIAAIHESFVLQHLDGRAGLLVGLTDDGARLVAQQIDVDGVLGHQLGDETLLADAGEIVDGGKIHREEMLLQPLVERAVTIAIGDAAHLGEDGFVKQLGVFGHEQKAVLGEQTAVEPLAGAFAQKQGAELGIAGVVVGEGERLHHVVDAELGGRVHHLADVIVVERLGQAHGRIDGAGTDHFAGLQILGDEEIEAVTLARRLVREGLGGGVYLALQQFIVDGQRGHAGAGFDGTGLETGKIFLLDGTDNQHK